MKAIILLAVVLFGAGSALAFEGSLSFRTIVVGRDQLAKLKPEKPSAEPEKAFSLSPSELMTLTGPAGARVADMKVYVQDAKVRADVPGSDGGFFIVDTAKNVTLLVVPNEKKCIEWTEKDTDEFAASMKKMQQEMEKVAREKLPSLPPEQRAQVEKMLKEQGIGAEPAKLDVRPLNEKQTINGMQTAGYSIQIDNEKTLAWVTQDHPEIGKLHRTVQEQMEKMIPPNAQSRQRASAALAQHGLPVMVQTLGPEQYVVQELTAITAEPVLPELFTVPADYTRISASEAMKQGAKKEAE